MISRIMEHILVVGTGITGAVTASLLRKQLPNTTRITLWDKANGAGGRMSTSRGPDDFRSTVDLGAQYISSSPENFKAHNRFYEELLSSGVLVPLAEPIEGDKSPPDTRHFTTPQGSSSLVKYFLQKADGDIKYNQHICNVDREGKSWTVRTKSDESSQFDCIVLTIPVPQVLQLTGTIKDIIDSEHVIKQNLENVSYSSRYALGLYYKPGTQINLPWKAKYIFDDPCIRFVSVDNWKRGIESEEVGPSVCVHTSVPFSLEHLEEDKEAVCKDIVLPKVQQLLPHLPNPDSVKCHKWRFSQVHKCYEGKPGAIVLQDQPLLVLGGDAFKGSGFDNCLHSAIKLTEAVTDYHRKASNL